MGLRNLQNSFLGGELAPAMLGRIDDASYKTGAAKIENFLIQPQGSLKKRPGFQYVTELSSDYVRLIPFRFSSNQTLVLVFTHLKLNIVTQGKVLLANGGSPFQISTPYSGVDLYNIDYCQNADIITLTSPNYPPMELRRYGATDWRFVEVVTAPKIEPPWSVTATAYYPKETDEKEKDKIEAKYVVTSVDKNNKESIPSQVETVKCNYYLTGGSVEISWTSEDDAKSYRVYRYVAGIYGFLGETNDTSLTDYGDNPDTTYTPPRYGAPFSQESGGIRTVTVENSGSSYTESDSISITDNTGAGASLEPIIEDGRVIAVNVVRTGRNYSNPTIKMHSDTGSGASFSVDILKGGINDYPSACTQYDQRRVFAGTLENPLKVWMTNAGQQDLMMYHIPTKSDDRIEITAVTADADRIKHAVALDSLILFTGSSELRVFTQNNDALTPESIAVRAQSYIGANEVQPLIANSNVVYVSARGGHIRHLNYNNNSGGYITDDLSLRATHLFDGYGIIDMTLSKAPIQAIWAVSTSGKLLSATYIPEQKILAWSQQTTNGIVKSVCAVSENEEDHVYIAVLRKVGGRTRMLIERMAKINNETPKHLDSFLEGNFYTAQNEVGGLNHLEGEVVSVINDGEVENNKVVKNGKIHLDNDGFNIVVGLPFNSTLVTVPLVLQSDDLQGDVKNVGEVSLRVSGEGDIWSGIYPQTSIDTMYDCDTTSLEFIDQDKESKIVKLAIASTWNLQGQIIIESRNSLSLEIAAIIGMVSLETNQIRRG